MVQSKTIIGFPCDDSEPVEFECTHLGPLVYQDTDSVCRAMCRQVAIQISNDTECPAFHSLQIDGMIWKVSSFESGKNDCHTLCCWDVWRLEVLCQEPWALYTCCKTKPFCQSSFVADPVDLVDGALVCVGSSERLEDQVRKMVQRFRFYTNDWEKFKQIETRMMIRNGDLNQWYQVLSVNPGNPPRSCPYVDVELIKWRTEQSNSLAKPKDDTRPAFGQWFYGPKESTDEKS